MKMGTRLVRTSGIDIVKICLQMRQTEIGQTSNGGATAFAMAPQIWRKPAHPFNDVEPQIELFHKRR